MGKELPAMNNYTWHILFRVLTTTAQPGQDTVFKYSQLPNMVETGKVSSADERSQKKLIKINRMTKEWKKN